MGIFARPDKKLWYTIDYQELKPYEEKAVEMKNSRKKEKQKERAEREKRKMTRTKMEITTELQEKLQELQELQKKTQKPSEIASRQVVGTDPTSCRDGHDNLSEAISETTTETTTETSINQSINQEQENFRKNYKNKKDDVIDRIDIDEYEKYKSFISQNIAYDALKIDYSGDNLIDNIFELIVEVVTSKKEYIRVSGESRFADTVKSVFLKLNDGHIRYVADSFSKNTAKVRNIKAYMITSLYNAYNTKDAYYKNLVNHEVYGGEE